MTAACKRPTKLPDKSLGQAEVEKAWATDLQLLELCRNKHTALRNYYRKRDDALRKQAEADAKN